MKKTLVSLLALLLMSSLISIPVFAEEAPAGEGTDASGSIALVDPINGWSQYDGLIEQIKAETDKALRAEMMHQAEDILMSTYCIVPLNYYIDSYLMKDYVSGAYADPYGFKHFMYASLSNGSDTLSVNLGYDPYTLDPTMFSASEEGSLAINSFSGLYTYNAERVPVPACAESYVVSEDGLTYTVTLKEGLKWSDGTDLTAADFEYSWKRTAAPESMAVYSYLYSAIAGYDDGTGLNVTAIDDRTLQFVLSAPCAYIEDLLANPIFYPVQQAWVEAYASPDSPDAWCMEAGFPCNGAYICTAWEPGSSMTYEKKPYWYDADNVSIEKIRFVPIEDSTMVQLAYNDGSLDFADYILSGEISALEAEGNPELYIDNRLGTNFLIFNAGSPLFAGKTPEQAAAMREAVSLLFDRYSISKNNTDTPAAAANTFIPVGMADSNGGLFHESTDSGYYDPCAFHNDPEGTLARVRELLESAGYIFNEDGILAQETPLTINYLTNDNPSYLSLADSLSSDCAELGIFLQINAASGMDYMDQRDSGAFDLTRGGWISDFNDPIGMLELWISYSYSNTARFGQIPG